MRMINLNETLMDKKSLEFAIRIINLYKYLCNDKREFIMSKQLLRSGTSIGANIREAKFAQSRPDFISKMSISLKETNESLYWLELLNKTDYITNEQYDSLYQDCLELLKLLHSTVTTSKSKL